METNQTTVTPAVVEQDDTDNLYDRNLPQIPKDEFDKRIGRIRAKSDEEINTWKTKAQELEAQVNLAREEGEKKTAIAQF